MWMWHLYSIRGPYSSWYFPYGNFHFFLKVQVVIKENSQVFKRLFWFECINLPITPFLDIFVNLFLIDCRRLYLLLIHFSLLKLQRYQEHMEPSYIDRRYDTRDPFSSILNQVMWIVVWQPGSSINCWRAEGQVLFPEEQLGGVRLCRIH